jgi:hypothetical protein
MNERDLEMTVSAPAELPGMSQADSKNNTTKLIVAVSIGNALEWYDISSYGYFAVYVSNAFFPNNDARISLLLTFGTFGLAFLIRPIGGVILGAYADRYGRKASLMVSIVLMTIGTLAIAIMPTYETIGILAPTAVLAARLVQGFSAGGGIRQFDGLSGRASARPPRLHRKLAICQPGVWPGAVVCVRRRAHIVDDGCRDELVGLAHSVPVRHSGRAGRDLYPQSSPGCDPATRHQAWRAGQGSLPASKAPTSVCILSLAALMTIRRTSAA